MDQLLDKLDSRIQTAVKEARNARQAAVSSPTVPAAPHLKDVEQAVRASMLASVSDSMTGPGPSCSFISSSTPISNQVPLKSAPAPGRRSNEKGVRAHPSKLPTPVRAARLEAWLEGYDGDQKQKLVSGFKRGFDVGYKGSLPHVRPHSLTSALQNPEEVDKKLSKESSMNRVAGRFNQESFSHFRTSPLGLVERKYQANLG